MMSLKETVKKYTTKAFLVLVSVILLLINGMQQAEMASLPTTSQINRMMISKGDAPMAQGR
ncbi:hypothetical protein EOM86_09160 [Candidatus Nomurabacteria bacterium]|nr:hypothetical protein [Candidatus Nomurabacteria bacterium]